jgi:orotidine-5'-phosphate decarboxylase
MSDSPVERYNARALAVNSLVCVGLDSDLQRLPERFQKMEFPQYEFNRWVIDQTQEYVAAYKPNIAFYEANGEKGLHELRLTIRYIREHYPQIFTICDAKRGDIHSTNVAYASAILDDLDFDAITLHPYLGHEPLQPFLSRTDKACIILCHTSNPGAGELQDLPVNGQPLWEVVAERVANEWNSAGNCMLVMGANDPEKLQRVREIVGDMTLLVPGVGAQGGDLEAAVQAGLTHNGLGIILNASRSITFSENPAASARTLRDAINKFRVMA